MSGRVERIDQSVTAVSGDFTTRMNELRKKIDGNNDFLIGADTLVNYYIGEKSFPYYSTIYSLFVAEEICIKFRRQAYGILVGYAIFMRIQ